MGRRPSSCAPPCEHAAAWKQRRQMRLRPGTRSARRMRRPSARRASGRLGRCRRTGPTAAENMPRIVAQLVSRFFGWVWVATHAAAGYPYVRHPGLAATRLLINHELLHTAAPPPAVAMHVAMPPITSLCQERALWRSALRHVGVQNSALPALWRRLAKEWPALFECAPQRLAQQGAPDTSR